MILTPSGHPADPDSQPGSPRAADLDATQPVALHLLPTGNAATALGNPAAAALRLALQTALVLADEGQLQAAHTLARRTLAQAAAAGAAVSPLQQARADLFAGMVQLADGALDAGLQRCVPALGVVKRDPHRPPPSWAYRAIGLALGALGDPGRGLAWADRAVVLAGREPQPLALLQAINDRGLLLVMLDDFALAAQALNEALALARHGQPGTAVAGVLNNLASCWLARAQQARRHGDHGTADAAARQALVDADRALAIATAEMPPDRQDHTGGQDNTTAGHHPAGATTLAGDTDVRAPWARLRALASRAEAHGLLGNTSRAQADAMAALTRDAGCPPQIAVDVLRVLAAVYTDRHDGRTARRLLDEATALCLAHGFETARGRLLDQQVQLTRRLGQPDEALAALHAQLDFVQARNRRRAAASGPTC